MAGCLAFSVLSLAGCGNTEAEDNVVTIDINDYSQMLAGEIWVVMPDGRVDKYENNSERNTHRYTYGIEYFLDAFSSRKSYYTERYKGATYVTRCQVKSIKRNYRLENDDQFETAILLTDDLGEAEKDGLWPKTVLTVEAEWDVIDSQDIQKKDSLVVASKRFDCKYDILYAPVELIKVPR